MGSIEFGMENKIRMSMDYNLRETAIEIPVNIYFSSRLLENIEEDGCVDLELSDILCLVSELAIEIGEDEEFSRRIDNLWFKAKKHFQ